jgi:hypothetical protein
MSTSLIEKIEKQINTEFFSKTLNVYTINKEKIKIKKFEYDNSKLWNPVSGKGWIPFNREDSYLYFYLKKQKESLVENEKLIGTQFILLLSNDKTTGLSETVIDLLKNEYNLEITKDFTLEFEGIDKDFTRGTKKIKFFLIDIKGAAHSSSTYTKITIYKEFIVRSYF